jgi:hypothetical protein
LQLFGEEHERRGRETAIRQGLPLFGVLGVLLQAKRTISLTSTLSGWAIAHAMASATALAGIWRSTIRAPTLLRKDLTQVSSSAR